MGYVYTISGYGQVEPNHLSAQRTGQIFAQLPAATAITVLENGTFLKYDYANGRAQKTGSGEFMLVFNEVKIYDKKNQSYKDFALKAAEAVGGVITPRLFKINDGDMFTTNKFATLADQTVPAVGALFVPTVTGEVAILTEKTTPVAGDEVYQLVKKYTMPDGTFGCKFQKLYNVGSGEQGYTGSVGATGYTGSVGATGYTGSQGDIGYTGSAGV